MLAHLAEHLLREPGAAVEHRHHHSEQFEVRVHPGVAHLPQHAVDHRDAFQRVILALERHQQRVRGGEGVERENPQRRRAINHDEVVLARVTHGLKRLLEPVQVVLQPGQLDLRAAQIHFAGDDGQALERGGQDVVREGAFPQQRAIAAGPLGLGQAHAAGGIGLRVDVHEEHPLAEGGEAGGEVDGGGGLTHATLLVRHGDDFGRHAGI